MNTKLTEVLQLLQTHFLESVLRFGGRFLFCVDGETHSSPNAEVSHDRNTNTVAVVVANSRIEITVVDSALEATLVLYQGEPTTSSVNISYGIAQRWLRS